MVEYALIILVLGIACIAGVINLKEGACVSAGDAACGLGHASADHMGTPDHCRNAMPSCLSYYPGCPQC